MGVDIYEDLLIIQKKCSNILDVEKKKYAKLPYGTLSVKKGNEYYCFYRRMPNSIVGIKKNPQLLRQLIQKKFLKSNLDYLEFASKEINKTVRALAPAYRKSQIPPLSDEVIKSANLSPDELHYTEEQFAWMSEKWPSNTKHPEQLIYTTKRGLKVRSKSELHIAEMLDAHCIPYHYDCLIEINGHVISPDFVILKPNGDWIIWEHFGLLSDEYVRKNSPKPFLYARAGFTTTRNLFITFEEDLLDMEQVEAMFFTLYNM